MCKSMGTWDLVIGVAWAYRVHYAAGTCYALLFVVCCFALMAAEGVSGRDHAGLEVRDLLLK